MKNANFVVLVALALMVVSGCAPAVREVSRSPAASPPSLRTLEPVSSPAAEGSLYTSERGAGLFSDFRARHVGDVVTVLLEEDLKGAKDVKTQTQRKSEMKMGLTGLFGLEWAKRLEPRYVNSPANATVDPTDAVGGSTSSKFDGSGKTSRDASLKGTVTARVIDVLPGGNILIRGSRELRINNETQYLVLTGVVRSRDLGPDNTISSTRIADARIEYSGGGVLSEKQSPAWFARLLGLMAVF